MISWLYRDDITPLKQKNCAHNKGTRNLLADESSNRIHKIPVEFRNEFISILHICVQNYFVRISNIPSGSSASTVKI